MATKNKIDVVVTAEDKASKKIANIWKKTKESMAGLVEVGTVAGTGIATGLGLAVEKFAEFEKTMSGVEAVLRPTQSEMQSLTDLAIEQGKKTQFSASQSAQAIEMLAKNGLNASQILGGALSESMSLAAAGGTDLATASDIATDVMSVFKIKAEDMGKAVNGIAGVMTKSKFDINDFKLALSQGGGVAAAVGVEFDDFTATIAGISPLFASGSDAGTSFKVMLQRLIPASNSAWNEMEKLGLISIDSSRRLQLLTENGIEFNEETDDMRIKMEELRKKLGMTNTDFNEFLTTQKVAQNEFFTTSGELKSMSEISGILEKAMEGLTEEQKNQALQTIFGTDAMRAAVGLADLGAEKFDKLSESIGKVDAQEMAKTRMDNLKGSMEILKSTTEGFAIAIGSELAPFIREVVNDFAKWLTALQNNEEAMQNIKFAIEGLVNTIKFLAEGLNTVIEGWGMLFDLAMKSKPVFEAVGNTLGKIKDAGAGFAQSVGDFGGGIIQGAKDLVGRANGGPVQKNTPFMVGERGPELFIPNSNGKIVSNNKMGGAESININFNNVNISNEADEDRLIDKIKDVFKNESKLLDVGVF